MAVTTPKQKPEPSSISTLIIICGRCLRLLNATYFVELFKQPFFLLLDCQVRIIQQQSVLCFPQWADVAMLVDIIPVVSRSPESRRSWLPGLSPSTRRNGVGHGSQGVAVTKIFNSASGKTVVPMSRPSITMPFSFPIACCCATISVRTKSSALMGLTLDDTSIVGFCSPHLHR